MMVMTISKKFDNLESYCVGRTCTDCKMLDEDLSCKLESVETVVEELFESVFGLNDL